MKWIEVKMKELGVSTHTQYKLCFMLDSSAMISVHTPKYGVIEVCCHNESVSRLPAIPDACISKF